MYVVFHGVVLASRILVGRITLHIAVVKTTIERIIGIGIMYCPNILTYSNP